MIHHEDGTISTYGSKSAKESVHLHYSAKERHYSPADISGRKISGPTSGNKGNCFYDAIAHQTGENPARVRKQVGKYVGDNPHKLKGTKITELESGGYHRGGGKKNPKPRYSKKEIEKAAKALLALTTI